MADIVDIEDSPSPKRSGPRPPTADELKQEVHAYLVGKDLSRISLKALRFELESRFQLPSGGLDARKGEIRQVAEALVTEAQSAVATLPPMAPPPEQEPPAKRRKMLATPQAAGVQQTPALSHVKGPAPKKAKKPKAPSAYALWCKDHRPQIVEELAKSLQRAPGFAEINKAITEQWKGVDEAQKAIYEQRAKQAKAELATEPQEAPAAMAPKAAAKKPMEKKGKGKGKGKSTSEDAVMTRAEFLRDCPTLRCALDLGGSAEASGTLVQPMDLFARTFKSGGLGYFSSVKIDLPVGSQKVSVQAQVVVNVAGSKYWSDGEGYEEALKAMASRSQEAPEASLPQQTTEVTAAPSSEPQAAQEAVEAPSVQEQTLGEAAAEAPSAQEGTTEAAAEEPSAQEETAEGAAEEPSAQEETAEGAAVEAPSTMERAETEEEEEAGQQQDESKRLKDAGGKAPAALQQEIMELCDAGVEAPVAMEQETTEEAPAETLQEMKEDAKGDAPAEAQRETMEDNREEAPAEAQEDTNEDAPAEAQQETKEAKPPRRRALLASLTVAAVS